MRAYAQKLGGDEELWEVTGLLHDFDYERWPSLEDHPYRGNEILAERGWSEEIRRAIMSHAEYSGVTRIGRWRRLCLLAMSLRDSSLLVRWLSPVSR